MRYCWVLSRTFNRIRLCQLRALLHQLLRQRVPCLLGREAQVDVRGGEVVGVELLTFFSVTGSPFHFGGGGGGRTDVPCM